MPGPHALPCLLCLVLILAPWALDVVKRPPPHRLRAGALELGAGAARADASTPTERLGFELSVGEVTLSQGSFVSSARAQGVQRAARSSSGTPAVSADGNGRMLGVIMGLLIGVGLWLTRRRLGE